MPSIDLLVFIHEGQEYKISKNDKGKISAWRKLKERKYLSIKDPVDKSNPMYFKNAKEAKKFVCERSKSK